jgi:hypothetical protein
MGRHNSRRPEREQVTALLFVVGHFLQQVEQGNWCFDKQVLNAAVRQVDHDRLVWGQEKVAVWGCFWSFVGVVHNRLPLLVTVCLLFGSLSQG